MNEMTCVYLLGWQMGFGSGKLQYLPLFSVFWSLDSEPQKYLGEGMVFHDTKTVCSIRSTTVNWLDC